MLNPSRSTRTLAVLFTCAALAACGGGDDTADAGADDTGADAQPQVIADAGSITGSIDFTGTPPTPEPIDMSAEPDCAAKHDGTPTQRAVVVNSGKLANVFVRISQGVQGGGGAPSGSAEVDQDGCVYAPHVVGVQTGQEVEFRNSDGLLHNIKASPANNRPFNISQPTTMTSRQTFNSPEVMVPVVCDVHGWMNMFIGVVDHPYFDTSGEDGSFTIANVAPGTYTVETWHEVYGVQSQQVTVEPNSTAELTFAYDAGMAATAVVPLGDPIDPHGTHASLGARLSHPAPHATAAGSR